VGSERDAFPRGHPNRSAELARQEELRRALRPGRYGRTNFASAAVRAAIPGRVASSRLRPVTLPCLVALKLDAGGYTSRLDVLERPIRNPAAGRVEIARVCVVLGLAHGWQEILGELGQ